jgi:hypothetical protein
MKTKLTTLFLTLITGFAFAHEGVELGPDGGRILDFSKDETMHGEILVKDGKFHINLLDQDMKPVKVDKQSLTATGGTREKPVKLAVEKSETGFNLPLVEEDQWLILQYKETSDAKAVTARLHYETKTCEECSKPEWLCECGSKREKK